MGALAELTLFQGGVLGLNTAAVLLLYKMHRDIGDVRRELSKELADVKKHHWAWIRRLRRHVWPDAFRNDVIAEPDPHLDGP